MLSLRARDANEMPELFRIAPCVVDRPADTRSCTPRALRSRTQTRDLHSSHGRKRCLSRPGAHVCVPRPVSRGRWLSSLPLCPSHMAVGLGACFLATHMQPRLIGANPSLAYSDGTQGRRPCGAHPPASSSIHSASLDRPALRTTSSGDLAATGTAGACERPSFQPVACLSRPRSPLAGSGRSAGGGGRCRSRAPNKMDHAVACGHERHTGDRSRAVRHGRC